MSDSLFRKVMKILLQGPAQALSDSTNDPTEIVAAGEAGISAPIFSEQAADTAASTVRVARVFYAAIATRVTSLGLVFDTAVTGHANNFKTFDVKKYANAGAIGAALATQITTTDTPAGDKAARTLYSFTLTGGAIDLDAGDTLVIDVGLDGGNTGVQLPKFEVVGATTIL